MSRMCTLHDLAMQYAKKQAGMIDHVTENAPILDYTKFKATTHGMFNVAEKLTNVEGAGWVKMGSALPMMAVDSEFSHTSLCKMGGVMEVETDKALSLGGVKKYFKDREPALLRKAGMDLEKTLVHEQWLNAAIKTGNLSNAGGKDKGWFILAVRFDDLANVGLYDPAQYKSGSFFEISGIDGGNEHYLRGKGYENVLGYSCAWRTRIGWQLIDAERCCAAIVNIDEGTKLRQVQIDNMLADVRATPKDTYLICSPKAKIYGIDPHKTENVRLANNDTDAKTRVETWNGITIITSYNIADKIDNIAV